MTTSGPPVDTTLGGEMTPLSLSPAPATVTNSISALAAAPGVRGHAFRSAAFRTRRTHPGAAGTGRGLVAMEESERDADLVGRRQRGHGSVGGDAFGDRRERLLDGTRDRGCAIRGTRRGRARRVIRSERIRIVALCRIALRRIACGDCPGSGCPGSGCPASALPTSFAFGTLTIESTSSSGVSIGGQPAVRVSIVGTFCSRVMIN